MKHDKFLLTDSERIINKLQLQKKDFIVTRKGKRVIICYENKRLSFFNGSRQMSYHKASYAMLRRVLLDCNKAAKDLGDLTVTYDNIITRHINYEALISNNDKMVSYIDIIACFWTIAAKNKFISNTTFFDLFNDKELRNLSLGLLLRDSYIDEYKKGIWQRVTHIKENPAKLINVIIRQEASNVYMNMPENIKENIICFKTDGFIVPFNKTTVIINYLKQHGFSVSSKFGILHGINSLGLDINFL